jgi:hypothetical protein
VQASQPEGADLLVFLLETGCRWSEAEKLTGGDVDLAAVQRYMHLGTDALADGVAALE